MSVQGWGWGGGGGGKPLRKMSMLPRRGLCWASHVLLPLLGINAEPVDPLPSGKIELSTKESSALNRLIQRLKQRHDSTDSAALLKLLTCPDAQQLEDMYTSSLLQRGEKELKGSTVQDQVSGQLRLAASSQ